MRSPVVSCGYLDRGARAVIRAHKQVRVYLYVCTVSVCVAVSVWVLMCMCVCICTCKCKCMHVYNNFGQLGVNEISQATGHVLFVCMQVYVFACDACL